MLVEAWASLLERRHLHQVHDSFVDVDDACACLLMVVQCRHCSVLATTVLTRNPQLQHRLRRQHHRLQCHRHSIHPARARANAVGRA